MSRLTQNILLFLVGLSAAVMVIKGTYLHYVKPSLMPWLIATASFSIVLALVAIVYDLRQPADHDGSVVDGHRHRPWLVWLLVVPIALTVFVVPPPLGVQGTAGPEVVAVSEPKRTPFPPLPAERAPMVSIPDVLMRASRDSANTLDGRLITTTGFTLKYPDGTYLARVVIICCAADARLARIRLGGPAVAVAAGYPEDIWLQVEGHVLPGTSQAATNYIPTMALSGVTRIEKPANTYEY